MWPEGVQLLPAEGHAVAQLPSAFAAPAVGVIQLDDFSPLLPFAAPAAGMMQPDVQYVSILHQFISAVAAYHPEAQ